MTKYNRSVAEFNWLKNVRIQRKNINNQITVSKKKKEFSFKVKTSFMNNDNIILPNSSEIQTRKKRIFFKIIDNF